MSSLLICNVFQYLAALMMLQLIVFGEVCENLYFAILAPFQGAMKFVHFTKPALLPQQAAAGWKQDIKARYVVVYTIELRRHFEYARCCCHTSLVFIPRLLLKHKRQILICSFTNVLCKSKFSLTPSKVCVFAIMIPVGG